MHSVPFRHSRGFSLLEVLGLLLMLLLAIGVWLAFQSNATVSGNRSAAVADQAREMIQIARAADQYLKRPGATLPTPSTYVAVDTNTLRDGTYLPQGFAQRVAGVNAPTSPLGQPYKISAVLRPGGGDPVYEIVVYADGATNPGLMARAGVANTTADIRAFAVDAMREERKKYRIPAALMNAGQTTVDTNTSGFTYNLATWMAPAPAKDTAITMLHFAVAGGPIDNPYTPGCIPDDADPFKCIGGPPNRGKCKVVNPVGGAAATCPSGTTKQATLDPCVVFDQAYSQYLDPADGLTKNVASAPYDAATYNGLKLYGIFAAMSETTIAGQLAFSPELRVPRDGRMSCGSGTVNNTGSCPAQLGWNDNASGACGVNLSPVNNAIAGSPFTRPPTGSGTVLNRKVVGWERNATVTLDGVPIFSQRCLQDQRTAGCTAATSTWRSVRVEGESPILCCEGGGPPIVDPPPTPSDCLVPAGLNRDWVVGANTCAQTTTSATTIAHGSTLSLNDDAATGSPNTGVAAFMCTDGLLSIDEEPGATCVAPPPPANCNVANGQAYSWTVAGQTCTSTQSGAVTITSGSSNTQNDVVAPTTGTAGFLCTNGAMSAAPNAGATCTTAPPANCSVAAGSAFSWTIAGQTCDSVQASATTVTSGNALAQSDVAAPTTGAAQFNCSNGTLSATPKAGATCRSSCDVPAGKAYSWLVTGNTCNASQAAATSVADGASITKNDNTAPTTGAADFLCTNGTLSNSASAGATCNAAAVNCSVAAGTTFNWTVAGQACTATSGATTVTSGSTLALTDAVAPATGAASFACNSGTMASTPQAGATCSQPAKTLVYDCWGDSFPETWEIIYTQKSTPWMTNSHTVSGKGVDRWRCLCPAGMTRVEDTNVSIWSDGSGAIQDIGVKCTGTATADPALSANNYNMSRTWSSSAATCTGTPKVQTVWVTTAGGQQNAIGVSVLFEDHTPPGIGQARYTSYTPGTFSSPDGSINFAATSGTFTPDGMSYWCQP